MKKQVPGTRSFVSAILFASISLLSTLAPANAAIIVYTDRDEWLAAIGGGTVMTDNIDYAASTTFTDPLELSDIGLTFNVTEGGRTDVGALGFTGSDLRLRVDPDDDRDPKVITGTFDGVGVQAFAFDFFGVNAPHALTRAHLGVQGQDYNLFDLGNDGAGFGSGFVGILSTDSLLTDFTFNNGSFPSGQDDFGIDNFEIVAAAAKVSEPVSLALLGLGLAGIGMSRRKK